MKTLILSISLIGFTAGGYTQGYISLDNNNNTNTDPNATSNGLFFLYRQSSPVLINQDFNAAFFGGTDSTSLTLIRSFSGSITFGDNSVGQGTFTDPSGLFYAIPGATSSAFFMVQAWTGNFSSPAAAIAGGGFFGASAVFSNPVGHSPEIPDLVNMPAVIMVPEPEVLALASLGTLILVILPRYRSPVQPSTVHSLQCVRQ